MAKQRNVQLTVLKALRQGLVLTVVKTKAASEGGRQTVTAGPRRTAVPDGFGYAAVYWRRGGQVEDAYRSADGLARDFIAFVGRDHAWRAALRALAEAEQRPHVTGFRIQ